MTREDAKVFMRKEWRECMKGSFAESAFEMAIEALEQPERKKGKWTGENACEFCGFQPWYERDIHTLSYCPSCGAEMTEDNECQST